MRLDLIADRHRNDSQWKTCNPDIMSWCYKFKSKYELPPPLHHSKPTLSTPAQSANQHIDIPFEGSMH
ncbi:hypothetical protein BJ165DRAFT_1498919 [Panaeolus papilionaceus]|nr:hypothetical protein BJ165DRAFT_1498919 [Panaeolus papilionaceus]